mmetsp:Transcript_97132/g.302391  ORF Transcript_97132/g.302391 Transcript_97132/m.302391 type:complete len:482 (-) Transcript_97132:644-2089(-)
MHSVWYAWPHWSSKAGPSSMPAPCMLLLLVMLSTGAMGMSRSKASPSGSISQRQMEHVLASEPRDGSCVTSALLRKRPNAIGLQLESTSRESGRRIRPGWGIGNCSSSGSVVPPLLPCRPMLGSGMGPRWCAAGQCKVAPPTSKSWKPTTTSPLGKSTLSGRGSLRQALQRASCASADNGGAFSGMPQWLRPGPAQKYALPNVNGLPPLDAATLLKEPLAPRGSCLELALLLPALPPPPPPPPPPPKPGSFIERPSLFRSMSTDSTRTFTSWPTESSSSTLSMKPSRMREMCTSPWAFAPSFVVASTKAPKDAMLTTVASSHSSSGTSTKGEMSCGALPPPPPPPILPSTMVRPNLPSSRTSETQHSTSWPSSTYSWMSFTRSSAMREMCTRPSPAAPMSTNAPKSRTLRTVPVYLAPTSKFSMGIGGDLMLLGLTGESSGPPSGSSHLTWKVPSLFTLMTVPGYICPSSGKTASTSSSTL